MARHFLHRETLAGALHRWALQRAFCGTSTAVLSRHGMTVRNNGCSRNRSAHHGGVSTRRFERDYHGYPTTLIVPTGNGAEERIARGARETAVGRSVSLPILLTCRWRVDDPTNPEGLLGRIWREPRTDSAYRRCWLTGLQSKSLSAERSRRLA